VWEAELHRLKGVLLGRRAHAGLASNDEVEAAFETALAIAQRQQAKAFELRAATGLARWWRDHGRGAEACALLEPVRAWFTEGFDTPDLIEADVLVRELGAGSTARDG
jgi:predicted ATPase